MVINQSTTQGDEDLLPFGILLSLIFLDPVSFLESTPDCEKHSHKAKSPDSATK